ncbi:MAG TPA: cytidylyltransferase [Candidatus Omnitrophica bacterium]|nr:cytidylyltransferase [Candidatus Omnitrophota bacterium]
MTTTVCALMLGREGSQGFPGKNLHQVLGRPLMAYPLLAARASRFVGSMYVSTDSLAIMAVGRQYGAEAIERPAELCTATALGEEAFAHGYRVIRERLAAQQQDLELLVLLFANAATVTAELIDEGIERLRADPTLDSAVTVSCYNMWSPLRARKIGADGLLHPFVPFETFGDPSTMNCDRDSQGDVYFADMSLSIVRPRCLEDLRDGLLPQRWMGQRIYPLAQQGGCDVDFAWQIPGVEHWLRAHGFSESATPYDPVTHRAAR